MTTVKCGREKPKRKSAARPCAFVCAVICAVSMVIFAAGDRSAVTVSSPTRSENSFWEDYAVFAARLFGYG